MAEERITIPGAPSLEGVLHLPDEGPGRAGVVVCHPHPLYGGTMRNLIVVGIARAVAARGMMALRFNFRGAGGSEGRHGGGEPEVDDVAAALAALAARLPASAPLGLAGYSFGALVSAAYAARPPRLGSLPARALALIGLPARIANVRWLSIERLREVGLPMLVIVGEHDDLGDPASIGSFLAPLEGRATIRVVPGADHYFRGMHRRLGAEIADFLAEALAGAPPADAESPAGA